MSVVNETLNKDKTRNQNIKGSDMVQQTDSKVIYIESDLVIKQLQITRPIHNFVNNFETEEGVLSLYCVTLDQVIKLSFGGYRVTPQDRVLQVRDWRGSNIYSEIELREWELIRPSPVFFQDI